MTNGYIDWQHSTVTAAMQSLHRCMSARLSALWVKLQEGSVVIMTSHCRAITPSIASQGSSPSGTSCALGPTQSTRPCISQTTTRPGPQPSPPATGCGACCPSSSRRAYHPGAEIGWPSRGIQAHVPPTCFVSSSGCAEGAVSEALVLGVGCDDFYGILI